MEDLALDRAPLEHAALLGLEMVDAGGEQRLDGRRHDDLGIRRVAEHRDHLLDEEGIPAGSAEDSAAKAVVDLPAREPVVDQQLAGMLGERLETEGHRPTRSAVEKFRPSATQQQN